MTTREKTIIASVVVVTLLISAAATVWAISQSRKALSGIVTGIAKQTIVSDEGGAAVIPALLGIDEPRTMLVLFLNNTEIRPGGGFIGSYGVVTLDKGSVVYMETDGSENLDRNTPADFVVEPPQPIKNNLISRWYFRDSNWSPDFVESSKKTLEFYKGEQGHKADEIKTVVAITPEVVEVLLRYTGPITAGGKVYTAENLTDLLEHTVEIDFHKQGIAKEDRKEVIGEIASEIVNRTKQISPLKWQAILADFHNLIAERHIMLYDTDEEIQKSLDLLGWSGRMQKGIPDKVMFVDANLASLKTDRVMERAMKYEIYKDVAANEWRGKISMTYANNGSFDWRTTRYNTYTRFFLPDGTRFISGEGSQKSFKNTEPAPWDVLSENGEVSIGSFFVIEPGKTKTVSVTVALAPSVVSAIENGAYKLYVQKQAGTHGFDLTVHHGFGTSVRRAVPAESPTFYGDSYFDWSGRVTKDMIFEIDV